MPNSFMFVVAPVSCFPQPGSSSGNSGPVESGSSFATPEMEGLEGMEGIDPDSEDPEGLPEVESC